MKHNISSLLVFCHIDTAEQFFALRNRLMNQLNLQKTNNARTNASVIIDKIHPTHGAIKKIFEKSQNSIENRLIIHTTYENRLKTIRKDIHQLWYTTFENTNVMETKLIIGTQQRRNVKLELVQTSPDLPLITLPKTQHYNFCM